MSTQGTLILLVFGGVALSHLIAGFGESLIRKGSVELDGEALKRINAHELRGSIVWRLGEKAAMVLLIAGILKAFFISSKYGTWGIPAMAAGFGLFCLSNIARAWISRTSFEREAPGSKASRGALLAGVMTTVAELLVAGAVCSFIYAHLPKPRTPVAGGGNTTSDSDGSENNGGADETAQPKPKPPPKWVDADEALKILKDRNSEYLDAIAKRKDIRSQSDPDRIGKLMYHRDDLVKLRRDGMPTWEEVGVKDPNPAKKSGDDQ